jgi:hypothetical protein
VPNYTRLTRHGRNIGALSVLWRPQLKLEGNPGAENGSGPTPEFNGFGDAEVKLLPRSQRELRSSNPMYAIRQRAAAAQPALYLAPWDWARTSDLTVNSRPLYQLSYQGTAVG